MSVGTFRHYLRVRIPTIADDGEGGQSVTWRNGAGIWADVRPVSAREQAIAGAVQSIASHRVFTHYDARITVERRLARVSPVGAELQIVGVRDPDGKQRDLEIDCAEVV